MPCSSSGIPLHFHTELFPCCSFDGSAILFRTCRVAQRLSAQITPVSDQLSKKHQALIWPDLISRWGFRDPPGNRQPIPHAQVLNLTPAFNSIESVRIGGFDVSAARQPYRVDPSPAHRPDGVRKCRYNASVARHTQDLNLFPHKFPDGDTAAVRKYHKRIAGDALAKICKNGTFI